MVIYKLGDPMCTIASAVCFNEPFEIIGKRMPGKQRRFAGDRFSDHIALLSLFTEWSRVRENGLDREEQWCTMKDVNMQTLRMTWEARRQLNDILAQFGFP